jgi:hypothetical protein
MSPEKDGERARLFPDDVATLRAESETSPAVDPSWPPSTLADGAPLLEQALMGTRMKNEPRASRPRV